MLLNFNSNKARIKKRELKEIMLTGYRNVIRIKTFGIGLRWLIDRSHPHLMIAEPHVSPAPNPAAAIVWPVRTFPLRTASSNANGTDAALVLP